VTAREADLAVLTAYDVIRSPNEKWKFLRSATEQRVAFLQQAATTRSTPNKSIQPVADAKPDIGSGPMPTAAADGSNRWIPLPSYRNGVWSLPRSPDKRVELRADYVGMAGNGGYLLVRQNDSVLMTSAGREALAAKQFFELGRDRLAFRLEEGGAFGVVTSAARIVHPPRLSYKEVDQMRDRSGSQPELKKTPIDSSLGTMDGAKVAVFGNSHPLAFPVAMDYNRSSGLLAVVQKVGSSEMASEVRVWDVHSRCCVFSKRLPAAPMSPVDVRISNHGLLFVSGGYRKFSVGYIEIFDLNQRALLHHFDLECARLSDLQVAPLDDGTEFISQSRPSESSVDQGPRPRDDTLSFFVTDSHSGKVTKALHFQHHYRIRRAAGPRQPNPEFREAVLPRVLTGIPGQRVALILSTMGRSHCSTLMTGSFLRCDQPATFPLPLWMYRQMEPAMLLHTSMGP
jgi:hypothetical protein